MQPLSLALLHPAMQDAMVRSLMSILWLFRKVVLVIAVQLLPIPSLMPMASTQFIVKLLVLQSLQE
jgi:hypothetical protein